MFPSKSEGKKEVIVQFEGSQARQMFFLFRRELAFLGLQLF